MAGRRVFVGVVVAAGAIDSVSSPASAATTTRSAPMRFNRPNPGTSSFTRYSALAPSGDSMTAYICRSFTATPAKRNPGGARNGVGLEVGTTAGAVAVAAAGGGVGSVLMSRRDSHRPDATMTANSASTAIWATRCAVIGSPHVSPAPGMRPGHP